MTDAEITALAREYAEWVTDVSKAEELPNCLLKEANKLIADDAERMLTWLSTRYCLAEKSKLTKMYKEAVDGKCELEKMQPQNTYAKNSILMKVGMNVGCAYTLKSLFPEIAKDVEK